MQLSQASRVYLRMTQRSTKPHFNDRQSCRVTTGYLQRYKLQNPARVDHPVQGCARASKSLARLADGLDQDGKADRIPWPEIVASGTRAGLGLVRILIDFLIDYRWRSRICSDEAASVSLSGVATASTIVLAALVGGVGFAGYRGVVKETMARDVLHIMGELALSVSSSTLS